MTNKTLLLIFVFFIVLYLIFSRVMSSRTVPPFDATLIQVDTAEILNIEIFPHKGPAYTLHHTDGQWIVSNGTLSLPARVDRLLIMLDQIDTIRTFELVSKRTEDWEKYGLTEKLGTRIKIYRTNGQKEDFIIGKTDFDTDLKKSIAYMRLSDQEEVFAVNGFLPFQLERHFNDLRNKELFRKTALVELPDLFIYQSLDTLVQFNLFDQGKEKNAGDSGLDSAALADYLQTIRRSSGSLFADDFDELSSERYFHQRIRLFYNQKQDSIFISCYRDSTRLKPFIIHSSDNPKSFFYSDSLGLYKSIFERFQLLLE
jgi:hypothetical protein